MAVITKGAGVSRANLELVSGEIAALSFAKSYEYYAVRNDGENDFYISTEDSACTPNGDNVVCVKAFGNYVHHNGLGKEGIVYFSGNGAVTVIGQDKDTNPFRNSWKGGVDVSLSKEGYAADSKVVGDKLKVLQDVVNGVTHRFVTDNTTAYSKPVPVGAKIASVNRVGGKTICFNQHLINGDMSQETGWECKEDSYGELQYSANNGEKCAKAVVTQNFDKGLNFGIYQNLIDNTGHKIYLFCTAQINTNTSNAKCYISCGFWNTFINDYSDPINTVYLYPNTKKHISVIFDTSKSTNKNEGIGIWTTSDTRLVVGDEIILYGMNYIDLTQMFGTGNEPATVEEFEAMFPADYYPYDEGTLMPSPVTAFYSTLDGRTLQTKEMPSAVLALEGYGDGINNDAYNFVEFGDKITFNQCIGVVDLGTLEWSTGLYENHRYFTAVAPSNTKEIVAGGLTGICGIYDVYVGEPYAFLAERDKSLCLNSLNLNTTKSIYIKDSAYTDAVTFKAAISGVKLYYELAKPIVTDITDLFPSDVNILDVMPGGKLVFENENKIAVPSEVEYIVDLAEVIAND